MREGNFELAGLMGREIHGRAVGIVGTGEIGAVVAKILAGFDAKVLAHDPRENPAVTAAGGRYVPLETLLAEAEIVTLHCPLTPATRHLIRKDRLALMRDGALLVNTGRGALIDAREVVDALKSGKLGGVALDVYEEEEGLFGRDHSGDIIADDVFARLLTFPNVVITGHQAYFTEPALRAIAETTVDNVRRWAAASRRARGTRIVAPRRRRDADFRKRTVTEITASSFVPSADQAAGHQGVLTYRISGSEQTFPPASASASMRPAGPTADFLVRAPRAGTLIGRCPATAIDSNPERRACASAPKGSPCRSARGRRSSRSESRPGRRPRADLRLARHRPRRTAAATEAPDARAAHQGPRRASREATAPSPGEARAGQDEGPGTSIARPRSTGGLNFSCG